MEFTTTVELGAKTAAGAAAGDAVEVDVEPGSEPRTVELPADLVAALDADPEARRRFDALSYSSLRLHALAVEGAEAEETRARRVAGVLAALTGGRAGSGRMAP